MITVRLKGGLGNQLFQLAAAIYISDGGTIRLLTKSLSLYDRPFEPDIARLLDLDALGVETIEFGNLRDSLIIHGRAGLFFPMLGVNDRNIGKQLPKSRKFCFLDGYFQNFWDTNNISQLANHFAAHLISPNSQIEEPDDGITIHIRGLDFQNDLNLSIIDQNWFYSAIKQCWEQDRFSTMKVVTDDIYLARRWISIVLEEFNIENVLYISSDDPIVDFHILKNARRRIIGNSTFAQWAMLLDKNKSYTTSSLMLSRSIKKSWQLSYENMI